MSLPPHTSLVLLSAIVGSAVAIFVWGFREQPGAKPLAVFLAAASLWSLSEGLVLATPSLGGKLFWVKVGTSVSTAIPVAWLATVLAYADPEWRPDRRRLAALAVELLVFVALVWVGGEGVVWTDLSTDVSATYVVLSQEPGLVMWAHLAYSYLLVAAGALALVRLNFRTHSVFRSQGTALLVAIFVPSIAVAATAFDVLPTHLDLTSLAFVVSGVVITGTLTRGKLFDVTPATREIGREAVIDELADRVLILDDDDRVVDVNPAAARLFDLSVEAVVGEHVSTVNEPLAAAIAGSGTDYAELELEGPDGVHYYDVRVSELYRGYGTLTGRVVSLRDVTDRRQREQRLDVLNRLLRHNIRNELNVVRGNAELLRRSLDDENDEVDRRLGRIEETADTVVERSEKVGRVSRSLERCCDSRFNLQTRLADLAGAVREEYGATVAVDAPAEAAVTGGAPIERALEELLENAAEHAGESPSIEVTAAASEDGFVEVHVADDGPGIDSQERTVIEEGRETALEHGSGVGLWLVNWVVQEAGGTIEFAEAGEGCTVVVRLPAVDGGPEGGPQSNPVATDPS